MNNYDFSRQQDENDYDYVRRLSVDKIDKLHNKEWVDIKEENNFLHSSENLRKYGRAWKMDDENKDFKMSQSDNDTAFKYKEVTEILSDGSQRSDKLISMSNEQLKDSSFLLKAHGFDENEWEVSNAKNSIWNIGSEKTLYSSRISVKPKLNGFNINALIEAMKKEIKPFRINSTVTDGEKLLTIPFVDLHFGINTLEQYQNKLQETLEIINSRNWDTIYIPIGHDLIHVNNSKNQTANGTQIENINIPKAWKDAFTFYTYIFEAALEKSNKVVSDYVCGNHDADMTWGFMQSLEVKFPQVKWNTSMNNKKCFKWEQVTIFSLHGERGLARVAKTLLTKYRDDIVNSKVIEIYSGHTHAEKVKDDYGIVIRTLPTSALEDDWHVENSFEGSVKTSQLFVYSKDKLKTIHHV